MRYTVKEVSKRTNLTPHTIRYYAKEGLFPFLERNESGVRMFKAQDFETIYLIECLKKSGMTIRDIKTFMEWCGKGDSTIDLRLEMFRKQQAEVERKLVELQDTLEVVKYKVRFYETAKAAGTTAIRDAISPEDKPESMRRYNEKIETLYGANPAPPPLLR